MTSYSSHPGREEGEISSSSARAGQSTDTRSNPWSPPSGQSQHKLPAKPVSEKKAEDRVSIRLPDSAKTDSAEQMSKTGRAGGSKTQSFASSSQSLASNIPRVWESDTGFQDDPRGSAGTRGQSGTGARTPPQNRPVESWRPGDGPHSSAGTYEGDRCRDRRDDHVDHRDHRTGARGSHADDSGGDPHRGLRREEPYGRSGLRGGGSNHQGSYRSRDEYVPSRQSPSPPRRSLGYRNGGPASPLSFLYDSKPSRSSRSPRQNQRDGRRDSYAPHRDWGRSPYGHDGYRGRDNRAEGYLNYEDEGEPSPRRSQGDGRKQDRSDRGDERRDGGRDLRRVSERDDRRDRERSRDRDRERDRGRDKDRAEDKRRAEVGRGSDRYPDPLAMNGSGVQEPRRLSSTSRYVPEPRASSTTRSARPASPPLRKEEGELAESLSPRPSLLAPEPPKKLKRHTHTGRRETDASSHTPRHNPTRDPPPPPPEDRPPTPPLPPRTPPPRCPPTPPPPGLTPPPGPNPYLANIQKPSVPQAAPPSFPLSTSFPPSASNAFAQPHNQNPYGAPIPSHQPPDRFHSNVPSRTSTPHSTSKRFRLRTEAQEIKALGHLLEGTTTLEDYDLGVKLGEGTFGVVTKATEKVGGAVVALKKLITHNVRDGVSVTTVREIKIIKALEHENVVPIRAMVVDRKHPNDKSERGTVFMVFPYMDHDLCGLLANRNFTPTQAICKTLMQQLLDGLAYIHGQNIIHRDIKTANILVDRSGQVMIADFGLARTWTPKEIMPPHMQNEYTNMVVTRWYRAPELLLGKTKYGPEIDMWSTGCILGEIYHRRPIICGETDRDQLSRIISRCGPIDDETFPGWADLPGFPDAKNFPWASTLLEDFITDQAQKEWGMTAISADLMGSLLSLDPAKRPTAVQALEHRWFWVAPLPAERKDELIAVNSSHEFTTRPEQYAPAHPPARKAPQQNHNQLYQQQQPGFNNRQQQQHQQQQQRPPMHVGGMQPQMPMAMPGMGIVPNMAMGYGQGGQPGFQPPQQQHVPYNQQQQQPYLPQQNLPYQQSQPPHHNGYPPHNGVNANQAGPPVSLYPPHMPPPIPQNLGNPQPRKSTVPPGQFALANNNKSGLPTRPAVPNPPFKLAGPGGGGSGAGPSGRTNGGGMGHERNGSGSGAMGGLAGVKRPPTAPAMGAAREEKRHKP